MSTLFIIPSPVYPDLPVFTTQTKSEIDEKIESITHVFASVSTLRLQKTMNCFLPLPPLLLLLNCTASTAAAAAAAAAPAVLLCCSF